MEIKEVKTNETKVKKITKKQQLINLISKPTGVRLETLVNNLGWQKHTTLGFISTLRKQGMNIISVKGGNGVVYRLIKEEVKKELGNTNEESMAE